MQRLSLDLRPAPAGHRSPDARAAHRRGARRRRIRRASRERRHADRRADAPRRARRAAAADPRVRCELHAAARWRVQPDRRRISATRRRDLLLDAYDDARAGRRGVRDVSVRPPLAALRALAAARAHRRDAAAAARHRRRCARSCRCSRRPEREREMLGWAARWFDAIFVHGDPRFARFEETFPFAARARPAGSLHGVRVLRRLASARRRCTGQRSATKSSSRPAAAAWASNCSRRRSPRSGTRASGHLHVARARGTQHPRSGHAAPAARLAGPRAIVERSRVDFGSAAARAFVSVSQAGYNTVLDVWRAARGRCVVPFTGNGETEQRARGERLREFDLAVVVDDRTLHAGDRSPPPSTTRERATQLGPLGFRQRWRRAHRRLLAELLAARRPQRSHERRRAASSANSPPRGSTVAKPPMGAVNRWDALDRELDAWRAAGRRATLWWRDDDACRDSPALQRLLDIARRNDVPVALAAIPAQLEPSLARRNRADRSGNDHPARLCARNHAPRRRAQLRSLAASGPVATRIDELAAGRDTLARTLRRPLRRRCSFRRGTAIDAELVARIAGGRTSRPVDFGPRSVAHAVRGPVAVQYARRSDRMAARTAHSSASTAAIERLVAHCRARREGSVDAVGAHRHPDASSRRSTRRRGNSSTRCCARTRGARGARRGSTSARCSAGSTGVATCGRSA